jgi:hypothetical protein
MGPQNIAYTFTILTASLRAAIFNAKWWEKMKELPIPYRHPADPTKFTKWNGIEVYLLQLV